MMKQRILTLILGLLLGTSVYAQETSITVSGLIKDKGANTPLSFVNVIIKKEKDSSFVAGVVSDEEGRFKMTDIKAGNYILSTAFVGYQAYSKLIYIGSLSPFIDLGSLELEPSTANLQQVEITTTQEAVGSKMDKKSFNVEDNISQSGGSALQVMQSLPGVTVQDGKVQLRGSEKITVLIDGKQTAITGFGSQNGLDNIPASAIEKIEVINNPSAKFDANGNAGIINIVLKKNNQEGLNGKIGLSGGLGALWTKKKNLPTIRPQYAQTPKVNPSVSLNYRKNKINLFVQSDYLYTETLNKNEFVTRKYEDGSVIKQQTKRNRNTHFTNSKVGMDWFLNEDNQFTVSGLFGTEKIIDRGDEPFFNGSNGERMRLWQFLEDELKTTAMATASFQHRFKEPGRVLNLGLNYTYHRENEKYYFDNILPTYQGRDAFKLLSDEKVFDFNADYTKPLKYGRIESGVKLRNRIIPTNMHFFPGLNSPLDTNAGGKATYKEIIPAVYSNYVFESTRFEAEMGLRIEYVDLRYQVNPNHNTYKSDGYSYTQPFPNLRVAYKLSENNKISLFYNRRVDRPNEVDIRIFPKYDDAEIIKVGNPGLRPQFTNSFEVGFKHSSAKGYVYAAAYHRIADATITRISTTVPGSNLIYAIFQNVNRSYNTGVELVLNKQVSQHYTLNINLNGYKNRINAFQVNNLYPVSHVFSADKQELFSGNIKLNQTIKFKRKIEAQIIAIYLAPDLIPQGKIGQRFSLDIGIKKKIQEGKGELFLNASDLLNTMNVRKTIQGNGFNYVSVDYLETQVVRIGYSYKF